MSVKKVVRSVNVVKQDSFTYVALGFGSGESLLLDEALLLDVARTLGSDMCQWSNCLVDLAITPADKSADETPPDDNYGF